MLRPTLLAVLLALLRPVSAPAQDLPVGTTFLPDGPTVIWSAPPTGILGAGPVPQALAQNGADGSTEVQRILKDPAAPSGYGLDPATPTVTEGLRVTDRIDVVQGAQTNTWLQVAPISSGTTPVDPALQGWVTLSAPPAISNAP